MILFLAFRVLVEVEARRLPGDGTRTRDEEHRHLHRGEHGHTEVRTPRQAFSIGVLHGLAGTGAIVLLLIAALPSQVEAMAAMAVFAPMSIVVDGGLHGGLCMGPHAAGRSRPVYRALLIPLLGAFGVIFGLWYVGLT